MCNKLISQIFCVNPAKNRSNNYVVGKIMLVTMHQDLLLPAFEAKKLNLKGSRDWLLLQKVRKQGAVASYINDIAN